MRVSVSEIVPLRNVSGLILFQNLGTGNGMCRGDAWGEFLLSLKASCLCLIDRQVSTGAFMVGWTGVSDLVTTAELV